MTLVEATRFEGELTRDDRSMPVSFEARINDAGDLKLRFQPVPRSRDALLIIPRTQPGGPRRYFSLCGTSLDGDSIHSDSFYFDGYRRRLDSSGIERVYERRCEVATLQRKSRTPLPVSQIIWHLRRFQTDGYLIGNTPLGRVVMRGNEPGTDPRALTGWMKVESGDPTDDAHESLLKHLSLVFSLAMDSYLQPVVEQRISGSNESFTVFQRIVGAEPYLPPFSHLDLSEIFRCGCDTFPSLADILKSLDPALQWLLAPAAYDEMKLITAITALENVLDRSDTDLILPGAQFKKFASAVRSLIKERQLSDAPQEKVPELNRLSFSHKLNRYIAEHNIVVDDFPANALKKMIAARNGIVHRGLYVDEGRPDKDDIWTHILLARELLTRIVLTSLQFRGSYFSALHNYQKLDFPSCRPP